MLRTRVEGSTQVEVARELGISKQQLNDILRGRVDISERVAMLLGFEREIRFKEIA
jgi:transcriptional regulator with XRE-family HTH domain